MQNEILVFQSLKEKPVLLNLLVAYCSYFFLHKFISL